MKIKTINKNISEKFSEFIASIKDEYVRKLVRKNSLISGGCITSMLLKEKVNDYDIYFTNKETVLAVATYYAKLMNTETKVIDVDNLDSVDKEFYAGRGISEAGRVSIYNAHQDFHLEKEEDSEEEIKEEKIYKVLYGSPNAISLSDKIQIIIRFYGTPEEIHKNYDYVHCTNYWLSEDSKLVLNQRALESILSKELIYVGSKYPIASILRTRKFIKRGWTINAGMYLKMCFQVSKLNLSHIPTLYDQLVGVDIAYFLILLDALNNAKKAHEDDSTSFEITYDYISEIIDRIF